MAELDLTLLDKAIASLAAALDRYAQAPDDLVRDACIHRFEHVYDLSCEGLRRYATRTFAAPADALTFQDLLRIGLPLLLGDQLCWMRYRAARGDTILGYDEAKAAEVFAIIPDFLNEGRHLRDRLSRAIARDGVRLDPLAPSA